MKPKRRIPALVFFVLSVLLILLLTTQNSFRSGMLSNRILDQFYRFIRRSGLYKYKFIYLFFIDYSQIRKLAHIAEYFLLGASAMLLFRKSEYAFLKAIGVCAAISFSDQFIKLFIPGREFDWTDLPYDAAGYLLGILLVLLILMIRAGRRQNEAQK